MAEIQCLKIRIQPGKTQRLVEWLKGLKYRPKDLREAQAAGGILLESLFLERTEEADYLVFYTRAENLARLGETFERSTLPLDLETKQIIRETWGEVTQLEPIVDLER
jgi:hypothetical protein